MMTSNLYTAMRRLGLGDVNLPELTTQHTRTEGLWHREREESRRRAQAWARTQAETEREEEETPTYAGAPLDLAQIPPHVLRTALRPADTLQRMLPVEVRIRVALFRRDRGEKPVTRSAFA